MVGYVVIAVVVLAVLYAIATYNRLVRQRNLVREGWSGIDVQLRRRADLVPNLVETVKGYAAHERGLFEEIAASRQQSLAAKAPGEQGEAERRLEGAIGRLEPIAGQFAEA
jgi:LemA protein